MQTPHPEYLWLEKAKEERLESYRALFKAHLSAELLKEIRESANKGLALGNERFKAKIEALTDRRVTPGKAGRPKKIIENAD